MPSRSFVRPEVVLLVHGWFGDLKTRSLHLCYLLRALQRRSLDRQFCVLIKFFRSAIAGAAQGAHRQGPPRKLRRAASCVSRAMLNSIADGQMGQL